MTHQPVRSPIDKLVGFFQRNGGTPVASERSSCPNSEGEANNAQNGARPRCCLCVRDDVSTERIRQPAAVDQEKTRYYQHYPVTEPLCLAFAIDRTLGRCCGRDPNDHKYEPTSVNYTDR